MSAPASSPSPRLVLLTGASSGIGRAAAVELARRGDVELLLVARRIDELERTIEQARTSTIGASVTMHAFACDLTDPEDVDRLATHVQTHFGRLDALVNNAGAGSSHRFGSPEASGDADRMLALNLRAPIVLTQRLLPLLLSGDRPQIVNVSSAAGLVGTPESPIYTATKWGLTGFSEALRAQLDPQGVRVVCVQPGPVPTPGWSHERVRAIPVVGRIVTCDAAAIARTIDRAVRGRGGVNPVRPRIYGLLPLVRGLAPWAVRAALAQAARGGMAQTATPREGVR